MLKKQILPIYIGGTHDLDYGQYLSYQRLNKLVSLVTVDAKIDMEEDALKMRSGLGKEGEDVKGDDQDEAAKAAAYSRTSSNHLS